VISEEKIRSRESEVGKALIIKEKAAVGIEPTNKGFAEIRNLYSWRFI
jgi:hypothetical protein